jgi:serine/threonine protein phosphatase PrpC
METASALDRIEWGVARKNHPGETVSGDIHVVMPHGRGVLLGVIDGSGHGPEAARAAQLAVAALQREPDAPVGDHLARCHAALARSRGAVMTLADFDARERTLTLCGVGNVEAMLFGAGMAVGSPPKATAPLRGGIVGEQLPEPYPTVLPIEAGDVLVMASDGLRLDFRQELGLKCAPQRLADTLLQKHSKGNDDALVLVVRFRDHEDD